MAAARAGAVKVDLLESGSEIARDRASRPRRDRAGQHAERFAQPRNPSGLRSGSPRAGGRRAADEGDFPMTETTLPTALPTRTIDHDVELAE
jgi:hypothetical protein